METKTKSMKGKIKYININLDLLISNHGFEVIELSSSELFGGSEEIILKLDDLLIMIVKERDQYLFTITNKTLNKNEWFDWDIVENYINGKEIYVLKDYTNDFNNTYNTKYQLKKAKNEIKQIEKKIDEIKDIFLKRKIVLTVKALKKLQKQRAKLLFG